MTKKTTNSNLRSGLIASQGLEFRINSDSAGYSLIGIGTCSDIDLIIPATYNDLPVTCIAENALKNCDEILSVSIPSSVMQIEAHAFENCSNLKTLSIPESIVTIGFDAFLGCDNIYDVHISSLDAWCAIDFASPDANPLRYAYGLYLGSDAEPIDELVINGSSKKISKYAFYGYVKLTSVGIYEGVTCIEDCAFYDCTNLALISLPNGISYIGSCAFYNTAYYNQTSNWQSDALYSDNYLLHVKSTEAKKYTVKSGTTLIASSALRSCFNLTEIELPGTLLHIGDDAFYDCAQLTTITLPSSLAKLGHRAFYNCTKLASINVPDSVEALGDDVFKACYSLQTVSLGANLTAIGDGCFSHCVKLTSVVIPDKVTHLGEHIFEYCSNLTSMKVGANVLEIPCEAFYNCYNLNNIVFGAKVERFGARCFYNCSQISALTLPDALISIGDEAFRNCGNLKTLRIGKALNEIGSYIFSHCGSLDWIDVDQYNESYTQINGNLYNKDETILIKYAGGRPDSSFYIPYSVVEVMPEAFDNARSLTLINISDRLSTIGIGAFSSCVSLGDIVVSEANPSFKSIDGNLYTKSGDTFICYAAGKTAVSFVLPGSVTSVAAKAINSVGNLSGIYYEGDEASWNKINIDANNVALNVIPHFYYSATKPADPTSSWRYVGGIPARWTVDQLSAGLKYKSNGDGSCTVIGIGTCTDTQLAIPSESPDLETVTVIAESAFDGCAQLTSIVLPDTIKSIGARAFSDCQKVVSINIPDTVVLIGAHAFSGCLSLKRIIVPESVESLGDYAFYRCVSLEHVTLSSKLQTIGYQLFYYCSSLKSIEIPSAVTKIGFEAFYGCQSLTSLMIPEAVTEIEGRAFADCTSLMSAALGSTSISELGYETFLNDEQLSSITLPETLIKLSKATFEGCKALNSIDLPSNLTSIPERTFYNCQSLRTISIPGSVEYIEGGAFYGCSALEAIDLPYIGRTKTSSSSISSAEGSFGYIFGAEEYPESLAAGVLYVSYIPKTLRYVSVAEGRIGSYAFAGCAAITEIALGDKVSSIDSYACSNCTLLSTINIPSAITSIASYAFIGCASLRNINIPDSITSIGSYAFNGCSSLTNVVISDSVTSIGSHAFYGCASITSAHIGNSITSIPTYCFANCSSLKHLYIGSRVADIGTYAFYYCSNLENVSIPESVTAIGTYAFYGCSALKAVFVPITPPTLTANSAFNSNNASRVFFVQTEASKTAYSNASYWSTWKKYFAFNYTEYIQFNPGKGSGSMDTLTIKGTATIPPCSFTPPGQGYYFTGWTLNADGSGDLISNEALLYATIDNGVTTLYAQWSNLYDVTFYKTYNSNTSNYLSLIAGGASSNTGKQEIYGCDRSDNGGQSWYVVPTDYYRGYFTSGKNTKIGTYTVPYGTHLHVWVNYDSGHESTTCEIRRQDGQVLYGSPVGYAFPVQRNTKITYSWNTSGLGWFGGGTSRWDCTVSNV